MDHPATRSAQQEGTQPALSTGIMAVRGGGSPLPAPQLKGTLRPGDVPCAPDRSTSPGLPFSSCSTATGSPGGGGSSTRLSSASTRPGRLGGQMPMWSPGWYCSASWPPVSRRTRIVARLGVRSWGS